MLLGCQRLSSGGTGQVSIDVVVDRGSTYRRWASAANTGLDAEERKAGAVYRAVHEIVNGNRGETSKRANQRRCIPTHRERLRTCADSVEERPPSDGRRLHDVLDA